MGALIALLIVGTAVGVGKCFIPRRLWAKLLAGYFIGGLAGFLLGLATLQLAPGISAIILKSTLWLLELPFNLLLLPYLPGFAIAGELYHQKWEWAQREDARFVLAVGISLFNAALFWLLISTVADRENRVRQFAIVYGGFLIGILIWAVHNHNVSSLVYFIRYYR